MHKLYHVLLKRRLCYIEYICKPLLPVVQFCPLRKRERERESCCNAFVRIYNS
jgi:hypothetical protein